MNRRRRSSAIKLEFTSFTRSRDANYTAGHLQVPANDISFLSLGFAQSTNSHELSESLSEKIVSAFSSRPIRFLQARNNDKYETFWPFSSIPVVSCCLWLSSNISGGTRAGRHTYGHVYGSVLLLRLPCRLAHISTTSTNLLCHPSADVRRQLLFFCFLFFPFLDQLRPVILREPASFCRLFPANTSKLITALDSSQWKSVEAEIIDYFVVSPRRMGVPLVIVSHAISTPFVLVCSLIPVSATWLFMSLAAGIAGARDCNNRAIVPSRTCYLLLLLLSFFHVNEQYLVLFNAAIELPSSRRPAIRSLCHFIISDNNIIALRIGHRFRVTKHVNSSCWCFQRSSRWILTQFSV